MHNEDEFDIDNCVANETPFDLEIGIMFHFGRCYQHRERQIAEFENKLGVKLPNDFLDLIGNNCEGGFDGWYQVLKDESGSIVWTHLLLMKLPDEVDLERDEFVQKAGISHIVTRILELRRDLFYREKGFAYLPFGSASHLRSDGTGTEGFLAFDLLKGHRVVYVGGDGGTAIPVADSFAAMMSKTAFQSFG